MGTGLLFYQLFEAESSTYTYLLGDSFSREAVLIDPVLETVERDLKLVDELGLQLVYVLDTHIHADHITGAGEIRRLTGCRTVVSSGTGVSCADMNLEDGDAIAFGTRQIEVITTPGHTNGCVSYFCEGRVFTGDALLIRGTGRTDFQGGSAIQLYDSITRKLFALPDDTLVYPAHDYRGQTHSTIGMEKRFNPRVAGKSQAEFVKILSDLKLANPKKIHEAVPANLACGQRGLPGRL